MNTFQLECFLTVANTLSFARAAEQLNVSQPAITHQIKMLEGELNVKLFRRSTRFVEITPEGQSFIFDAKSMISIAAQAKTKFSSSSEKPIEQISIGCSSYAQLNLLTGVLNSLKNEVSNLHPRLLVLPPEQLFQFLETERIDVIFDVLSDSEVKGRIKYKELFKSNLVCVCRREYKLAEKDIISIKELEKEVLIFCDPINLTPDIAKLQWQLSENRERSDMHFCPSSEAAYVLARAGIGVAVLPELLLSDDEFTKKIPLDNTEKLSFGIFYKSFPGDSVLKRFITISQEYFSSY